LCQADELVLDLEWAEVFEFSVDTCICHDRSPASEATAAKKLAMLPRSLLSGIAG